MSRLMVYGNGTVSSVNGKTGAVVLNAEDVKANAYGDWVIGTYVVPFMGPVVASTTFNSAFVLNELELVPLDIPFSASVDRVGMYVNTAGAAGNIARLGLFTVSIGAFTPFSFTNVTINLVTDFGTVLVDSAGLKTITITQTVAAGRFWLGLASNASTGQWVGDSYIRALGLPENNLQNTPMNRGRISLAIAAGDVTNGFSASYGPATTGANEFGPRIGLRRVS